jgi:phage FluMu protein Com
MTEVRCKKCNRLLMKVVNELKDGIHIKCPKCHYLQSFNTLQTEDEYRTWARRTQKKMDNIIFRALTQ